MENRADAFRLGRHHHHRAVRNPAWSRCDVRTFRTRLLERDVSTGTRRDSADLAERAQRERLAGSGISQFRGPRQYRHGVRDRLFNSSRPGKLPTTRLMDSARPLGLETLTMHYPWR